jgi:putative protease
MKFAVTIHSINQLHQLKNADIIIAGNKQFANRLTTSFELDELKEIRDITKAHDQAFFINASFIMHNRQIEETTQFLEFVKTLDVDGILFGDTGVFQIADELGLSDKLIYEPDTLATSYADTVFWNKQGIQMMVVSKEVSLRELTKIGENKSLPIAFKGHGYLHMFHSGRRLLSSFNEYANLDEDTFEDRTFTLEEELRDDRYPILEDEKGTHVFRSNIACAYRHIKELESFLDVFMIDGILLKEDDVINALKDYKAILSGDKDVPNELPLGYDEGFLTKLKGGESID